MEDQADGVCLECYEGEGEANVVTEPEPEGDRKTIARRTVGRRIVIGVTDHLVQGLALLGGCCQFRPDLHPGTKMLVDLLFTDLDADILDHSMADVVDPEVLFATRIVRQGREIHLQKERGKEFGLAGDDTTDASAEIGRAVEGNRNGLNREGSVAPVHLLEEGELGVVRQKRVLTAAGHQLKEGGGRHPYCPRWFSGANPNLCGG